MLDTITVNAQEAKQHLLGFDFSKAVLICYFSICILLIINFLIKLFVVILAIQKIKSRVAIYNGVHYYDGKMAFSFFKFIALPQQLAHSDDADTIAMHERAHSRQWHTLDIMLADILCAVFWINPVAWMYRKSLKETHEYLADAAVKEQYCDIGRYQMLLLNNAVGTQMGLANCFNQSLTLKRLIMLTKKPSTRIKKCNATILIPITAILLLVFACNKNQENSEKSGLNETKPVIEESVIPDNTTDQSEQNLKEAQLKQQQYNEQKDKEKDIYTVVEQMPTYPGGEKAMIDFLITNLKYPQSAKDKGIEGVVYVQFVVLESGNVDQVQILKGTNPQLDEEALRVVNAMPKWNPGTEKGKAVKVKYNLPIKFALGDKK